MVWFISFILAAYLLGSIPTAVWIGRIFYGIDVREYGSGNAGATNTFRVLGKKAGIPVLLIDILKGWFALQLCYFFPFLSPDTEPFVNFQLILAISAVLGHVFPVFAQFKGGKGVATLLGIGIGLHPAATCICILAFIVLLIMFHYVSVGSMAAGLLWPILVIGFYHSTFIFLNLFAVAVAILLVFTHKKNIQRLREGTESKIYLFKRQEQNK